MVHQVAGHDKSFYGSRRELEFQIAEDPLAHRHQPAGARLFLGRQLGDAPQAVVTEQHLNSVSREGLFVLADDTAFGSFQDQKQVIDGELLADHADRQAADELRFEAEIDEIARLRFGKNEILIYDRLRGGGKTDRRLAQPLLDYLLQAAERAADDK